MSRRPRLSALPLIAALWLVAACDSPGGRAAGVAMSVDTIGDTVRIITRAGSRWTGPRSLVPEVVIGELDGAEHEMFGSVSAITAGPDGRIYVLDRQVPTVRVYGPDGDYLMSFGTEGGGPGELGGPDSGLALLSDGRLLVRDPGNQRIQVFDRDGEPAGTWRLPNGLVTSEPIYVDTADNVWSSTVLNLGVPLSEWEHGFLRFDADGDSLPSETLPVAEAPETFVEARGGDSWNRRRVPFTPSQFVRVTRFGEYVNAYSAEYAFDVLGPGGGVLRIGRSYQPVPVSRAEAETARRRTIRDFRRIDPDWTWDGPDIPSEKPPYRDIFVGLSGRYWLLLHEPGSDTGEPAWDAEPGEPTPPSVWSERVVFDVFERDGTYLGRVVTLEGFQTSPDPVFRGDTVWAVMEDALGVERVARLRLD